ncbi:ABC transporter ATP-binding protein [Blastopirellula marina]|uniref:ABC transporter, ATP-binding protein n=1 Tax=Blastopirellula marina DSM 3645 TaxID=314230 RepID=A3ZMJ5_9BACT|nr:ABC transporter ATP-binding protein [Blastopirellula marina]EAQ82168.1 ABC transporter, ATP-binding protein [Blastopirellula marina DSM 3645]
MIQLETIAKQYSGRGQKLTAFRCEALTIEDGEYVAIVGPSGSGKTTLLSMLGGMLSPSTGRVLVDDVSLYDQSVAARSAIRGQKMGFVFQSFNLIPYLSALQNVQVPLSFAKLSAEVQQQRATELLVDLGLSERLHHRPAELSVGQQQRVALARTLVNDPQIILADEPTGNLDPTSKEVVLKIFDECHQQGRTLVVVTHDPSVAERATRRLTLVDGNLVDSDEIETSTLRPASAA